MNELPDDYYEPTICKTPLPKGPTNDALPYTREELARLFEEAADDIADCEDGCASPTWKKWRDRAAKLRGGE